MIRFRWILNERGYKVADIYNKDIGPPSLKIANHRLKSTGALGVAEYLKRTIKRYAPVFTSTLRDSIFLTWYRLERTEVEIRVWCKAPYAAAQGYGFAGHYIPIEYIERHERDPYEPAIRISPVRRWVFVKNSSVFMPRAYQSLRRNINKIWGRAWYKAMVERGKINRTLTYG